MPWLSTTYGGSLLAKLASVAATGVLGLLGLLAARRLRPSMRLLRAEAVAAVGMLDRRVTPALERSRARAAVRSRRATDRGYRPGDGQRRTTSSSTSRRHPIDPGQNFVTMNVLDTLRPPPARVRSRDC